jgi:hypothetical protein
VPALAGANPKHLLLAVGGAAAIVPERFIHRPASTVMPMFTTPASPGSAEVCPAVNPETAGSTLVIWPVRPLFEAEPSTTTGRSTQPSPLPPTAFPAWPWPGLTGPRMPDR